MESRVGRALQRATGAGLLFVAVVALVRPRPVITPLHQPVVVLGVALLVAGALVVRLPRWLRHGRAPLATAAAGGVVAAVTGLAGLYPFGWDARVVLDIAATLESGAPLTRTGLSYLSRYPNNLPLLAIDEWGHRVGALLGVDPVVVLVLLSGVAVAVTMYAVHDLVSRVAGPGPAIGAQLVTLALVATSPWLAVPYTDVYAMPFVAGACALGARGLSSGPVGRRVLLLGLGLIAAVVAYALKTTPVVVAVAGTVTGVVSAFDRPRPRRDRLLAVTGAVVSALVFVGLALVAPSVAKSAAGLGPTPLTEGVTPTVLWWVANGAQQGRTVDGHATYGSYSRTMVTRIRGLTPEQTNAYARGLLAHDWKKRGLRGTGAFYVKKLTWNWGDGMFTAWGEGGDSARDVLAPAGGPVAVVHALNGYRGAAYSWRSDLAQSLWVALLLVTGAGLLRAPYRREVVLLAVTVLGIAVFTLVFQGRARYLFTFVPVVAALGAMVHGSLPLGLRRPARRWLHDHVARADRTPTVER
jgi:hypothetical protein